MGITTFVFLYCLLNDGLITASGSMYLRLTCQGKKADKEIEEQVETAWEQWRQLSFLKL